MFGFEIGGRPVGVGAPPYIIAEAGVHHRNDVELACRYMEEAAKAGASAIKFQTYTSDRLAARWAPTYWDEAEERTQHEIFSKRALLTDAEYQRLADYASELGIHFLSTPFDPDAAALLARLGVPAFKIASADVTHLPLLREVASHGRPVLLSTGASTMEEVQRAVDVLTKAKIPLALLHCSLAYPTPLDDANLRRIMMLKESFPGTVLGYSDHTLPPDAELACALAVGFGASVVEKHFTLEPSAVGDDHLHAVDPEGLRRLVDLCGKAAAMTAEPEEVRDVELPARTNARRSIVAARNIDAGTILSEGDIDFKRPGTGLPPGDADRVLGRRVARYLERDALILPDHLE